MSDKSLFATFARTKPHDSQISMAVVSLLLKFNWTTIAFVYSDEERLLAEALLEVQGRKARYTLHVFRHVLCAITTTKKCVCGWGSSE